MKKLAHVPILVEWSHTGFYAYILWLVPNEVYESPLANIYQPKHEVKNRNKKHATECSPSKITEVKYYNDN